MMKRSEIILSLLIVMLAISLPHVFAWLSAGPDAVFAGSLTNPLDGASYLAKMQQGWAGEWRFTLPFTAEPGNGAFLFLFYLFLGHVARWFGLSLILTFHLARLVSSVLLMLALLRFFERIFPGRPGVLRFVYWLAVLGSGMGWLVVFLGPLPADFWVAEAYPFFSMFSNPHFPLGLAALVWALTLLIDFSTPRRELQLMVLGLFISVVNPFALVVLVMVGTAWLVWTWWETRCLEWRAFVSLGILGGPFLLYQFWAAQTDPVLAGWNAQNLTPSPPLWDVLISFSPVLLLAFLGLYHIIKTNNHPSRRILAAWFLLGFLLIYFPFSLQRRFMLGFYIPTTALAGFGLIELGQRLPKLSGKAARLVFALALPTNLLLILMAVMGAGNHSPSLYLSADEARGLDWLASNTPEETLVLASPEMGRWVPVFSGRRVLYGHPYETVNAEEEEQRVMAFYQKGGESQLLSERGVDYVFVGPREQALAGGEDEVDWDFTLSNPPVFSSGDVKIYAVDPQP